MTVTIENLYTGNGSTTDYSFTFPYLDTTDIKVSLATVNTTAYSLLNATTVRFTSAPGNGVAIRIYRETAFDTPKATFYPGSAIRAGDLNDNTLQNLYVNQESNDKVADAWLSGDPTVISSETWYTTDDTKVATTKAIENRINSQIDSALTDDVVAGSSVTIADDTPSAGKITVSVNAASASATGSMSAAHYSKLEGVEVNATADQTNAEIRTAVEAATDSNVFTDADHSKLNAIEASATADQTDAEIKTAYENNSDTNAYTDAEKTKLSGIETAATADQTNAEIRTAVEAATDSNVFTDADHTKLNSCESNSKDDQTAAEIKTLYESNTQTNPLTDAEKAVIDGVTANTSELNKLDGYTGSVTNLNIVSGKSFRASGDGTLTTTSDTEIPSSKVIASHVSSTILATGGFITINNEISFPVTASQPANGVIVSISDAAGTVINGSGVSTTGRTTDGTPATVTINNFPSSLNGETLATGVGLLVTSTGSSNTYNYHKILAAETDVKQLSDDINDFNARYRVASSAPSSALDDGDLWFDTSANKMKVYNATGSSWDDVASVGQFFINTISSSSGTGGGSATFNGSAYRFTLSNPATGGAAQLLVSVNGVLQKPNAGSSQPSEGFAISGNDIIFSSAPASGSDYYIVTQGSSVSIGTPSANSVNSSHIIDGSIVNGDISNSAAIAKTKLAALDIVNADVNASAAIAGSKLADDSIAEVKLDVHNAPATDKYLKYTSNGMEWSDGASEGTDVKSTGESGTTKFLRVDGDGTCSWQVPPDTNTQVGGATGVNFNDSVRAKFGTDLDLHVYHNGSNSVIREEGTGNLNIQTTGGNVEILVNTTETAAKFISEGAVEIYHDDSKKLETTSSGINVTGQINVNGSALSAAPEITATASGAIAAHKACCVNTNGTVSQIAESTTPSSIVSRSTANTGTAGEYVIGDVVWITATDFIAGGRKDSDSNKAKRFYGKVNSGGTITLYSENILGNNNSDIWNTRFATDTSTEIFLAILMNDGANDVYIRAGEVNSNNTGVTFGAPWYDGIGSGQYASAVASNNNGEYMIGFIASDNQMHFKTITVNSSTLATTQSSSGSFSTFTAVNAENTMSMIYVPSVGMYWTVMVITGNYMRSAWIKSNGTGSAPTCTTDSGVITSGHLGTKPWLSLDPSTGKVILSYKSHNSSRPSARVLTITGSSSSPAVPTFSSETQLTTESCDDIRHTWARDAASGNGKAVFYIFGDDTHIKCYTLSGTTLSDANNNLTLFAGVDYQYSGIDANPSTGRVITATRDEGNSNRLDFNCIDIPLTTTNFTTENFIGFSAGAYSDTNTATINVVGNTTTQSSLTPAQKYYVQSDGTIALTAHSVGSVFAGTSLSSTKLLIKG